MKKRLASLFLCFALVLSLLPAALQVKAETVSTDYIAARNIWVGKTQVTSENCNDVLGDGTVKYDASKQTLYLNGVTITDGYYDETTFRKSGIHANYNLIIDLTGKNTIDLSNTNSGIMCGIYTGSDDITFTGYGTLDIICGYANNIHGLDAMDTVNFDQYGRIRIWATEDVPGEACGIVVHDGKIKMNNGIEEVYSIDGPFFTNSVTFITAAEGSKISYKENGSWYDKAEHWEYPEMMIETPTELTFYFTDQPADQSVKENEKATFSVAAESDKDMTYQWEESKDNGNTWTAISGATGDTYEIADATYAMNGYQYRCVITCADTASTQFASEAATLRVSTQISKQKITLSSTSVTYGTYPTVTIKDVTGKKLVKGTDYTLTYAKNVGKATVKITGKGNFLGTTSRSYKINPKGTSLSTLTKGKKAFTVKWKK